MVEETEAHSMPQPKPLHNVVSLEQTKRLDFASRAMASAAEDRAHEVQLGEAHTKHMTKEERDAYVRGDQDIGPHRNTAKDISPRRSESPKHPELNEDEKRAGRMLAAARERYRAWKEGVFVHHGKSQRTLSAGSDRAKREISRNEEEVEKVQAVRKSHKNAVDAIEKAAAKKGNFEIEHDEDQEEVDRERRREEYVKWHLSKYGRPPNPNYFRGVSESGSDRSGSVASARSGRHNRSEMSPRVRGRSGKYSKLSNLNSVKLNNFN